MSAGVTGMDATGREGSRVLRFFITIAGPAATAIVAAMIVVLLVSGRGTDVTVGGIRPVRKPPGHSLAATASSAGATVTRIASTIGDDAAVEVADATTYRPVSDPHAGMHREECHACTGGRILMTDTETASTGCPTCGGSGRVSHLTPDDMTCFTCGGSGRIPGGPPVSTPHYETCAQCGGTGFIWVED
jgi:hypothetical protein